MLSGKLYFIDYWREANFLHTFKMVHLLKCAPHYVPYFQNITYFQNFTHFQKVSYFQNDIFRNVIFENCHI